MTSSRILADDLTGALDAAAPFATPDAPVEISFAAPSAAPRQTASSESREVPLAEALALVRATHERLRAGTDAGTLWFKKVDSVLRGWPVEETLELMRLLGCETCLFAPAFPEMGRRTLGGLHEVRDADRPGGWGPAEVHDLCAAFRAAGAEAEVFAPGSAKTGVLIGDAQTEGELRALVGRLPAGGVLWAGSRGLAEALFPPRAPLAWPRLGTLIVGTTHPVTRRQVQALRDTGIATDLRLIDPVPGAATAAATIERLEAALAELSSPAEEALMVIGGNTLTTVLETTGARALACEGEIAPGLPASRIVGGRLDGRQIITKSGGFGSTGLLVELQATGRG